MRKPKTKKQYVRAIDKRAEKLTDENYHSEASLYYGLSQLINSSDFGEVVSDEAARILDFIIDKGWD